MINRFLNNSFLILNKIISEKITVLQTTKSVNLNHFYKEMRVTFLECGIKYIRKK